MESCSWLTVAASVTCAAQQQTLENIQPYILLGLCSDQAVELILLLVIVLF
jgi:uncharacterized protein YoaH (UPF0181 family)